MTESTASGGTDEGRITIRPLVTLDDMRPAVELQRVYWGSDLESVVPAHMLFSLAQHGGHVLAAFAADQLVGILIGFLGTDGDPDRPALANLQMISKRMVVLPAFRGGGVGYRLKLAQRQLAIRAGVRLVTWTFDPLLALNAHLNLHKLAAVCPAYLVNYYGTSEAGGLAALGSSDRLAVEWWVTHRRVDVRLSGARGDLRLPQYLEAETPILNATALTADGFPVPPDSALPAGGTLALLEIPTDYPALKAADPALAIHWRETTRAVFQTMLGRGYVVTDFLRAHHEGRDRAFYVLSYTGPQFESFRMN